MCLSAHRLGGLAASSSALGQIGGLCGRRVRARLRPGGLPTFAVGLGLLAATDLSLLKRVGNAIRGGGSVLSVASSPGREIGSIPIGLAGWAMAAPGVMLLIASIALYAAAALRRRRACRTFAGTDRSRPACAATSVRAAGRSRPWPRRGRSRRG